MHCVQCTLEKQCTAHHVIMAHWGQMNSITFKEVRRLIVNMFHYVRIILPHLTHWGRVTHICVIKLTIIGSDNSLLPGRCQAIIWTNAGLLLIGPLGTNFSEILIKILTFSFKKMRLKVSSAKQRPFCLGLNVLNTQILEVSSSASHSASLDDRHCEVAIPVIMGDQVT